MVTKTSHKQNADATHTRPTDPNRTAARHAKAAATTPPRTPRSPMRLTHSGELAADRFGLPLPTGKEVPTW